MKKPTTIVELLKSDWDDVSVIHADKFLWFDPDTDEWQVDDKGGKIQYRGESERDAVAALLADAPHAHKEGA